MSKVADAWRRIEAWYKANVPEDNFVLAAGATAEDIEAVEDTLALKLPKDVKDSYRLHNGSNERAVFAYGRYLLSLREVQEQWNVWRDLVESGSFDKSNPKPTGPIKRIWWNLKWIPITHSGSGDHECVDMDPDTGCDIAGHRRRSYAANAMVHS